MLAAKAFLAGIVFLFSVTLSYGANIFPDPPGFLKNLELAIPEKLAHDSEKITQNAIRLKNIFYEEWTPIVLEYRENLKKLKGMLPVGKEDEYIKLFSRQMEIVDAYVDLAAKNPRNRNGDRILHFVNTEFLDTAKWHKIQIQGVIKDNVIDIIRSKKPSDQKNAAAFVSSFLNAIDQNAFYLISTVGTDIAWKYVNDYIKQNEINEKTAREEKLKARELEKYLEFETLGSRTYRNAIRSLLFIIFTLVIGVINTRKNYIANYFLVSLTAGVISSTASSVISTFITFWHPNSWSNFVMWFGLTLFFWILLLNIPSKKLQKFPRILRLLLTKLPPSPPPAATTHGSARWASLRDVEASKHLAPTPEAAIALGWLQEVPEGRDNRFWYSGHATICAPTGSGKGIGVVIPALLEYPGSMVVLDIKGENFAVSSRRRRALGHSVYVIDPFGVNSAPSSSINVLDRLDLNNPDCVGDAGVLAESIVIRSDGDTAFWDDSAQKYLEALILYVKTLDDPERRNLQEVRRLVTLSGDELLNLFAEMELCDRAFGVIARMGSAMHGKPEKERGSILSTAQMHTAFLDDPRIAKALSRSDFALEGLKKDLMTIYIVLPPARLAAQARFVRLLVGNALAAITATPDRSQHRVIFMLDEFAQLGHMRQIEDSISLVRGYGASYWLMIQDLSQLKGVYKKWQSFLANSAKVFFGVADFDTAKYVSDTLGTQTIEYKTDSESTSKSTAGFGFGMSQKTKGSSQSTQRSARALLTPDEVMKLGPELPIVLISGEMPYKLRRLNYLSDPAYRGLFDPNPYHG